MLKKVLFVIAVIALLIAGTVVCIAADKIKRVQDKIERVKNGINTKVRAGQDPSRALELLKRAKDLFDSGKFESGETELDSALNLLGNPKAPLEREKKTLLPALAIKEEFSDLYIFPEEVQLEGNNKDCMEPMISRDGEYLFFNDNNEANVETHIHILKRTGKNKFADRGILTGSKSTAKDMAPTIDGEGNFYFTSTRSYDQDLNTLFVGKFSEDKLTGVRPVTGDIRPKIPGWLNMDCCISADGKTLVVSRARFEMGSQAPSASDLFIATQKNGSFYTDANSAATLAGINTPALEYAPELSEDKLRLFFTRAFELIESNGTKHPVMRIMYAERRNIGEPFGNPKTLSAIQGFVEAPSLSADASELYFHKKEHDRMRIYRVRLK